MSQDVIVTGRRYTNAAGVVIVQFNFTNNASGNTEPAYDSSQNNTPNEVFVKVNIKIGNSSNSSKANEAASNIAAAVAALIAAAQALPGSTPIPLPRNQLTSVDVLLTNIQNTTFVITDDPNFHNGGVGGADHLTMTDTLYFASFSANSGQSSYADAQWNGQGINGAVFHELGHLSSEGYVNLNAENTAFNNEMAARGVPQNQRVFYGSDAADYALDAESFAQAYALSAAQVLGIDISTFDTILRNKNEVSDYVGADTIYNEHMSDG